MATYYVDSNATGLNSGTSWADAWTSLASAFSVAAGDTVLVSSSHVETVNLSPIQFTNSTPSNPVKLISANTTTSDAQYGASFPSSGHNGKGFRESLFVYGCVFYSGYGYTVRGASNYQAFKFHNCRFDGTSSDPWINGFQIGDYYRRADAEFIDCVWDFSRNNRYDAQTISASNTTSRFVDCEFLNTAGQNQQLVWMVKGPNAAFVEFDSCDLSKFDYLCRLQGQSRQQGKIKINNCNLKSGFSTFVSSPIEPGQTITVSNSSSGTISSQSNLSLVADFYGETTNETSVYRSSGANNGDSNYSWKMESNANANSYCSLQSAEICKWVESGSQTITLYVASAVALGLYQDGFWIEVESPSEETSPTGLGKFRTTKPNPLAITSTLATDSSSSWTGSGVGTKQKIDVAIAPTIAGTVTVRCYLAAPSTTVYVDPKISSDGNQRVFDGVLVDGDPTTLVSPKIHPLG